MHEMLARAAAAPFCRCTCQQAKVKVPVTLDNDDPVAIGQRIAQSQKLLEHAKCSKLSGAHEFDIWHEHYDHRSSECCNHVEDKTVALMTTDDCRH